MTALYSLALAAGLAVGSVGSADPSAAGSDLAGRLAGTDFLLVEVEERNDEPARLPPSNYRKKFSHYYSHDAPAGRLLLHDCDKRSPDHSTAVALRYHLVQGRVAPPDRLEFIAEMPMMIDPFEFAPSVYDDYTPYRTVSSFEIDREGREIVVGYSGQSRRIGPGAEAYFADSRMVGNRAARTELSIFNRGRFRFEAVQDPGAGRGPDCLFVRVP